MAAITKSERLRRREKRRTMERFNTLDIDKIKIPKELKQKPAESTND
jgi:hypothetical protein